MGKWNFHGYLFNFAILSYSRNSQKFDAREKYVFYSKSVRMCSINCVRSEVLFAYFRLNFSLRLWQFWWILPAMCRQALYHFYICGNIGSFKGTPPAHDTFKVSCSIYIC